MPSPSNAAPALRLLASISIAALIALGLAWELWLAPLRPGGSWIALKVLPLALALPGVIRGKRYTFQWVSLLLFAYFIEGVIRGWSDQGTAQALALAEVALAVTAIAAAVGYARASR